jgi:hypothetical protein
MAALVAGVIAGMAGIIVGKGAGDMDLKYLGLPEHREFVKGLAASDASKEKELALLASRLSALEARTSTIVENESRLSALSSQISILQGRLDTALMSKRAAK